MDHGLSDVKSGSLTQETRGGAETSANSEVAVESGSSMDPHGDIPESRMKQDRGASPAASYVSMKSDWSMDHPDHFKPEGLYPDSSWIKKESSDGRPPSYMSMASDTSSNPPIDFKRQTWTPELREFSSSLLTTVHVRCCMCSAILRDPVLSPCGHSYCRRCITTRWSQPGPAGDYACPQCEKSYPTRPMLYDNAALSWMLQALQQALGFSPARPTLAHEAGPGDEACNVFPGLTKLRAVKTCLTCSASTVRIMSENTTPPRPCRNTPWPRSM